MARRAGSESELVAAETSDAAEAVRDESIPDPPEADEPSGGLVPGWLALLVLVLLLAVAVLAGFVVRGLIVGDTPATPSEMQIEDWQDEVAKNPDDPEALLGLGYAYQQEGESERALELYDQVLVLDEGNTGALYNKGVLLLSLGRSKEAETTLWDVLESTPDHVLAAKALGEYYIGEKHYKSALAALEPVIETRPEFADLQYLAGYSCEQLGLDDAAIEYYRGALKYVPDHADARTGLERLGADL